ncbi:tRNA lysidine(34) synthetase TilS [Halalkalibacter urbisdiaboli]|uniref:tRNA lysidine(34) synthetase TilS n=1 Tax=Halalkalibacter urbisdiaboli TaxID=1960589 RepID=UPI000B439308|nr:tRNA lysidine(34) synthetase TilS [Halalkalibacter urbisdiaboli]
MKRDVHKFIQEHQLFAGGETVIVAVSGGPDSMALLHYLWSMKEEYRIDIVAAHAHHQLRGTEADKDERFIETFCQQLRIPLYKTRLSVKEYAEQKRIGIQTAARELRYNWLDSLLPELSNRYIATGHHGDDQIETFLMKLIRGSIPFQLTGIAVKRKIRDSIIIRPFLGITKEQIEHYCSEVGVIPRRDSSNESTSYTRNRFRFQMLPFIKQENKQAHLHFQRQSEWLEDDQHYLMMLAEERLRLVIVEKSEQKITISREAFLKTSVPLQRRMIHLILKYISGKNSPITPSIHIEQVIALLQMSAPSKELHLANDLFVYRDYQYCHFSFGEMNTVMDECTQMFIPGEVKTKLGVVKAYYSSNSHPYEEGETTLILDAERVAMPLVVRTKKPGDRVNVHGMTGAKKVSRLFIDRKISKHLREAWPVIVDANGDILWVPLLQRSRLANVYDQTKQQLILTFEPEDMILKS